jgi:hypothetical protein
MIVMLKPPDFLLSSFLICFSAFICELLDNVLAFSYHRPSRFAQTLSTESASCLT